MKKYSFLFILCFLLTACNYQPDAGQLRETLEQKLSETFGPERFKIAQLIRRGSAIDNTANPDEKRRVVYYDVVLELKDDIELCTWDKPGAAALITLMGAGPKSITGVKSNGNKAGDRIIAHGSAIYSHIENNWKRVAPASYSNIETPEISNSNIPKPVSDRLISAIENITNSMPHTISNEAHRVVQQELERSLTRINGRLTRLQNGYPFTGGPSRSEYLNFAQALASVTSHQQVKIIPLATSGSIENIDLLRNGDAILSLAQADFALMAFQGKGPFEGYGAFSELRTLGSLYPEFAHIVVRNDNQIHCIDDLRGKKVALGSPDSGGRTTIEKILSAHGLEPYIDYQVIDVPFSTAVQYLNSGKIDAATQVIGIPASPLRSAMTQANLKLLSLNQTVINKITKSNPAMLALSIAEGTYPNQIQRIQTIGTAALMLTTSDLTMDEAASMVNAIYRAGQDLLSAGSAQGAQVSVTTSKIGLTIPMHIGAIEALRKIAHTTFPRAVIN